MSTAARVCLLAFAACAPREPRESTMHTDILTTATILDFAPIESHGELSLLVLQDDARGDTRLQLLSLDGAAWRSLGTISPPAQARGLDLRSRDGVVLAVWESNSWSPLELSSLPSTALTDVSILGEHVTASTPLALGAVQSDLVALEHTDLWNTLTLSPRSWVFNPRLVHGAPAGVVVANTADGQAMFLANTPLPESLRALVYPQAFAPQALFDPRGPTVAFMRLAEATASPYWSLPRYHGTTGPHPGNLVIAHRHDAELDLSLTLGPILSFSLLSRGHEPWLLALRDAPVGVQVLDLDHDADTWIVSRTLDLDEEIHQLRALPSATGWSLFGAGEQDGQARLHHWRWSYAP